MTTFPVISQFTYASIHSYLDQNYLTPSRPLLLKFLFFLIALTHSINSSIYLIIGKDKIKVLTICNTGSLATAGYGTALGVVRSLHAMGKLEHVYACETRPYNQVLSYIT